MSREILDAMTVLGREKGIAPEKLRLALEDALLSAYKKQPDSAKYARVELDPETADFRVIELIIPERLEAHLIVETIDEGTTYDPETGEMVEPTDPEIDPAKFEEYKDQIDERDVTPGDFGRIAAQTAKQVILQRIREAERDMMFEEYRDRVGELITGIVQQSDSRYTLVQLRERVEALLPKSEQVDGERYDHSQRVKAVIKEVSPSTKGPSIIVVAARPRAHQEALRARGAGDRRRPRRDRERRPRARLPLEDRGRLARRRRRPGRRLRRPARLARADGRLRAARREDRHHPLQRRARPLRRQGAVSPARVREVLVDDDGKQATVIVPDDQLSLAIGREGQNARLAARLTGWRIDIKSETEFAAEEQEQGYEEEETQGRCAAVMSTGRRCPNAALPGSRYCGLDSHQALANQPTDEIARRRGAARSSGRRARRRGRRRRRRAGRGARRGRARDPRSVLIAAPQRRCVGCGTLAAKADCSASSSSTGASKPDPDAAAAGSRRVRVRPRVRASARSRAAASSARSGRAVRPDPDLVTH